jgi:hypothetical protein
MDAFILDILSKVINRNPYQNLHKMNKNMSEIVSGL